MDTKSQNQQILAWLKQHAFCTAMDALREFGCFRLSARIYDLRQQGHDIQTDMGKLANGKRIAFYWLNDN